MGSRPQSSNKFFLIFHTMGAKSSVPELGEPKIGLEPSRVVKVNHEDGAVDIAYRVFREELKDTENGGVVVWQHAYGDTSENVWAKCKVDMLDGYCVITPDALGHGTESSKPTDPKYYTSAAIAANIAAILDQENVKKAHYIGYSMGGYFGCCLLAHCPERWLSMAIGGWNPEGVLPGWVAWLLKSTYTMPWMDSKRDTPALTQACYALCNPVPDLDKALTECSQGSEGYPRVHLWAGESDVTHHPGMRNCSQTKNFPLVTVPGDHELVSFYVAGIEKIRDSLLKFLKPVE